MMRIKSLCLLAVLVSTEAVAASSENELPIKDDAEAKDQRCQIAVSIGNLRKSGDQYRGQVCYTLFKGKEGFPDKSEHAYTNQCVPVQQSPSLSFTVKDLPCDSEYALALLHDENMNRQLDKNLGLPKEGIGMSNNPSFIRVNSPHFDEVKFLLQAPRASQTIHIHYF